MAENKDIWVFSEKPTLLYELIAGARAFAGQIGGGVVAVVLGPRSEAEQAIARGADRALWLGEKPEGWLVDDYVPTLAAAVNQEQPFGVWIGATKRGKAVAGRLAVHIGVTVVTDVKQITVEAGGVEARHLIFGGGAMRTERPTSAMLLATFGQSIFEALPAEPGKTGEVVEARFVAPVWKARLCEKKSKGTTSVNLAAARRVVCPGRGLGKQEDLAMVNELARLLEAEVGCTRPLAEGLDWLPRERYIGVSGAFVKPDLYLGIGVSGQVQHTVGITDSRVVVGINKDKDAPIFPQADYGIVADLYTVVPALIKALQARK